MCYVYTLTGTDNVGNVAAPVTSSPMLVDTSTTVATASAPGVSSLTFAATVPNKPMRMLIVGAEAEFATNNSCQASGVTYGGVPLTEIAQSATGTGSYDCSSLWYMAAPPVGTANVVVTYTGTFDASAGAVSLWNIKQGAPDAFNTSFSNTAATTTNVTTVTPNSTVIDIFGTGQPIPNALVANPGQVELETTSPANPASTSHGMSTEPVATPGLVTFGWTQAGINRSTEVVAAFAPGDVTPPTESVTTPASDGLPYNATSLPANIAGTSADTGGSGVSTVQVAIQDGAGNYWGGATFNQAAIFYNATGGSTAAWTYGTGTLVGQLVDGHTYTVTVKATDAIGNTSTNTRTFVYDTTAPTVTNVTSTKADGAYPSGTLIPITVTFSEPVNVTGTPTLALNSGGSASYSSGSGTNVLTFNYTVAAGNNSADLDYSATNSLALSGGTIKDAATNNANLTLPAVGGASSIGGQKNIVVDTTAPTVTNVTSTKANGAYPSGTLIPVTVTFSENVTVTGTPTLALNSGGTASYSSGSGSNILTFNYTTAGGENTADLDYSATNSLALSGGTIKDAATNNATLTLPAVGGASSIGGQKAIVVDTNNPTASVTTPAVSGNSYNGTSLPASLAGSSADTGGSSTVSSVQVAIQDGAGNYWGGATFNQAAIFYNATGGTTNAWTYSTATLAGQLTNGHTYTITAKSTDPAGNTGTATRTFVYDSAAPTVTNVSSTKADGAYPSATSIPVTVTFSENVTVTGTPTLALNSGGTASYSSGSGSNVLTFNYTTAGRREHRRPRLPRHQLARPLRRHDQGRRHQQRHPDPPRRRRRQLDRRPESDRRRHQQPDRVGDDAGCRRQHLQRDEPARESRRLLG